jgi:hypothetical protein
MQRATPTSTHSPIDSPPSRDALRRWIAGEPGLDEEREVELCHVLGDEQRAWPDDLGATAGVRQRRRELGDPVWITQSNSHVRGIGTRGPEDDYRSG